MMLFVHHKDMATTFCSLRFSWNIENIQATPRLSEDKVRQCIDSRINGEYPPKAVAKVIILYFLVIWTNFEFFQSQPEFNFHVRSCLLESLVI